MGTPGLWSNPCLLLWGQRGPEGPWKPHSTAVLQAAVWLWAWAEPLSGGLGPWARTLRIRVPEGSQAPQHPLELTSSLGAGPHGGEHRWGTLTPAGLPTGTEALAGRTWDSAEVSGPGDGMEWPWQHASVAALLWLHVTRANLGKCLLVTAGTCPPALGLGGGQGLAQARCLPLPAYRLQVPLKVSLSAGRSWGHLVPLQEASGPWPHPRPTVSKQ